MRLCIYLYTSMLLMSGFIDASHSSSLRLQCRYGQNMLRPKHINALPFELVITARYRRQHTFNIAPK